MVENARRLGLDLRDVEAIALSHGHLDHVAGMEGVARVLGPSRLPVVIHPDGWGRRRLSFPGLAPADLPTPSRTALRDAGFELVEERQPSLVLGGCLLVTGEVDRTTPFERGFPGHEALVGGAWEADPRISDDQALVARVARGLVVLSGCGHAGIVNTVRHARRLTGEDRIAAVTGGFHLLGLLFEPVIGPTLDAFGELAPGVLAPAHCTGRRAVHALAGRFPGAFVRCVVGNAIEL